MAIQTPPPSPASPPSAPGSDLPEIRDIAPPVDVFPYPPWMVALAVAAALFVLGLLIWWFVRWLQRRPGAPPLTPRAIAIRELTALQAKVDLVEPYEFSVAVSDVLRTYIGAQYGLRAKEQTSPEFLASISNAPQFSEDDKALLSRFLEKCDLIKFAHIDATSGDSSELLSSALGFVQGVRA